MERIGIYIFVILALTCIEAAGQTDNNHVSTPTEEQLKQSVRQQDDVQPLHIIIVHDQAPNWRPNQPPPPPTQPVQTEAQILERQKQQEKEQQKLLDEQKAAKQADLVEMAHTTRTFYVQSETILIDRNQLIGEVRNRDGFKALDLVLVDNPRLAEIELTVDYIPWTFDYTFKAVEKKTSVVLVSGKITAFNGYFAAMEVAHSFVGKLTDVRNKDKKKDAEKTEKATTTGNKLVE